MKHFEPNKNSTELGIDTTRKFKVVRKIGNDYKIGDIVTLGYDNNSDLPLFKNEEGDCIYIRWENLYYADEELKQGNMVYVSDKSEEDALKQKNEREFMCMHKERYMCLNSPSGSYFIPWKYAVKVPTETEEEKEEEIDWKIGDKYCLIHTDDTLSYGIIDFIHNENGEINYSGTIRPGFERLRKPTQEELDKYFR